MDYGQDEDVDKQITTSKEQSAHILDNMSKDVLRDLYLRKLIQQRIDRLDELLIPEAPIADFIVDFNYIIEEEEKKSIDAAAKK